MCRCSRSITAVFLACAGLVVIAPGVPGYAHDRAAAAAPRDRAIYGHVSHLGWVVHDLDAVTGAWRKLGVHVVEDAAPFELPGVDYGGRTVTVRLRKAVARFENAVIQWLQPLGGGNAYYEFLASHGDGVQHVAFSVPSAARLDEELAHFRAHGVGVIQSGAWQGSTGTGRFAYLDTAGRGGGMTIELEFNPDGSAAPAPTPNEDPFTKVTQYAFVVRDLESVSAFYERIGLGALPFERNVSLDRRFRGKPADFEMFLGWGRSGDIVFEWIQPLVGPTIYEDHLERHGEGFHHLGFNVSDMDGAIATLGGKGLQVTMSGGWDSNGSQGRFAYLDTEKHGGVAIELLWNKRE